jgi:nickel transport protein
MASLPAIRGPGTNRAVLILTGALLTTGPAVAHDLWLERDGEGFLLQYGHRHSGHAGEERLTYDPAMVRELYCFEIDGAPLPATRGDEYPVRIDGPCAALHVLTSTGFWARTSEGLRNQPASELKGVLRSWESVEGVKFLDAWSESLAAPLTPALKLIPLQDPFALKPGAKLRLLVSFEGMPRTGVTVAYDGEPRGVSDAGGHVNIRLRRRGSQAISASFETLRDAALAELTIHATVLNFDLPGSKP